MVFSVRDGVLEPVLQHAGALEFWVLKGVDARALRKTLPSGPCYVKLAGDRVLEKWYAGGFSVEREHGRLYSFFLERPLWVKTPEEMTEVQGRILAEREAVAAARNEGDFAGALARFRVLRELEKDWPVGIPEGEERAFRTLEALDGMATGDAPFLLSVVEGLPASRYEFDQTDRIRQLLLARLQGADPALASRMEFQLLQGFKERYKDRSVDTACLDLVEMLSVVGAKRSVLPMDDYYQGKVLPGPWKEELKARFAGYLQVIRDRAKASGP